MYMYKLLLGPYRISKRDRSKCKSHVWSIQRGQQQHRYIVSFDRSNFLDGLVVLIFLEFNSTLSPILNDMGMCFAS